MLPRRKKRIEICTNRINKLTSTVAESRREINRIDMENQYLKGLYPDGIIETCCTTFGLDVEKTPNFISWPVFLGTSSEEINICAVNFGALSLSERRKNNEVGITVSTDSTTAAYINAAINTLVVTNLKEEKGGTTYRYWPTRIDYTNKSETGTINQTTLSLSSLLRFGFLDMKSKITQTEITYDQLLARFKFVIDNINWILSLQEVQSNYGGAWSYADECKESGRDKKIATAILPSQFCYEVLKKYYEYFTVTGITASTVTAIDSTLLNRMNKSCENFERWIENEQREDGGYRRNSNCQQSSFAHSCCAMLVYAYDNDKNISLLNGLIRYLWKNHNHFEHSLGSVTDLYRYKYRALGQRGYAEDAYEAFPESLFANNSIKAIEDGTAELLKASISRKMREINYIAFEKILDRFETIEIEDKGPHDVVKGRQEISNKKYPIYVLYYTKICLEKLRNNESLPYKRRKKYISTPISSHIKWLLMTLLCLGFVALAYVINATDTMTTIVLGIASFIAPSVAKNVFSGIKYKIED